jgi:glycosyltransferase involved in cell wall biosynthesis
MGGSRPTISIIVPNYNHAAELQISLAAMVEQTRPIDEIVVIDDASTDNSLEVIGAFAARYPAVRLIRHTTQQGAVAALNRGITEATGSHVILASADDRILPNMCEQMDAAIAQFPDARLIVSKFTEWYPETNVVRHGEDGESDLWFTTGNQPVWVSPERFQRLLGQRFVCLATNTAMFARAAMLEVGLLDPGLQWHSDWFAIYATAFRHGFVAVPQILTWYRIASGSYSTRNMSLIGRQKLVIDNLHSKLDRPEFADIRIALMRAPSAMSPFMRATLLILARQPRRYPRLARIALWWLREVVHGRRPRRWANIARRLRKPRVAA